MAPIKSSALRILGPKLPTVRNPRMTSAAYRGLTATSLKSASIEPTKESTQLNNFNSRDIRTPLTAPFQYPVANRKISNPFDALLNSITHSLSTTSQPDLPILHSLLRSYTSESLEWTKYAHANPDKQYTRNLVTEVPNIFNLLLLVWTPGKASPVHDHADAHCLMKVLKGTLRETRFRVPEKSGEGPLEVTGRLDFGKNKVAYISDKLGLHEISNPHPTEYAVSLHLYTPPNAALRGCHIFDPVTGDIQHVMSCPYDSVRGVVTSGHS